MTTKSNKNRCYSFRLCRQGNQEIQFSAKFTHEHPREARISKNPFLSHPCTIRDIHHQNFKTIGLAVIGERTIERIVHPRLYIYLDTHCSKSAIARLKNTVRIKCTAYTVLGEKIALFLRRTNFENMIFSPREITPTRKHPK